MHFRSEGCALRGVSRLRSRSAMALCAVLLSCMGASLPTTPARAASDAAVPPARSVAPADSLIDPARYRSLAADHRAYRTGDLLTIYVQETTRAKSQAATEAGRDVALQAHVHSPTASFDGSLGYGGGDSAGAQTTRVGELRTQISARVVGVDADGNLRIAGEQSLMVNGERQRIRIAGLVRPADIDADNAIWSHRIAEADIELVGVGTVSASQRRSVVYRALQWLGVL